MTKMLNYLLFQYVSNKKRSKDRFKDLNYIYMGIVFKF